MDMCTAGSLTECGGRTGDPWEGVRLVTRAGGAGEEGGEDWGVVRVDAALMEWIPTETFQLSSPRVQLIHAAPVTKVIHPSLSLRPRQSSEAWR